MMKSICHLVRRFEMFNRLYVCPYIMILESKNRMVPIPKANIHQQSAVMFGKDSIEKLKTEKYPIDDYKIPTYREVMDKSIPKKSHVHVS